MSEDLITEFLIESHENLDRLDRDLVRLEQNPHDRERLASVFRTIHTIKGTCGFLAFGTLEEISHEGESLLSKLRDGELALDTEITTGLLSMVDAIRAILASVERTGTEGDGDYSAVMAELARLNERRDGEAEPRSAEERRLGDRRTGVERRGGLVADSSLRIDVALLDTLMNLVGELVLARNQIVQFMATQSDPALLAAAQRLTQVTSELQEGVIKTRMQPIGCLWSRFPRVVRDLATQCGKQVRIEMEGSETDLDKTVVEAIKDPLTHLIRNSVDHGIEPPDVRLGLGKPAEGCIRLRAFHESGQMNIEIADDGAGVDPAKVRARAVQCGLVAAETADRMREHELVRLIFLPGFSTADRVTHISGRGVGMDVVRANIEAIGGQVDLRSVSGQGTTLRIRIPLTLAIVPALIVGRGDDRYAIPHVSLLELVRLEGEQARQGIQRVGDARFYRRRGELLPLLDLDEALGLEPRARGDVVHIVVLKAVDRQFGLVVEAIHDTEEIVVKPLGRQLKHVSAFAGATIMGDGRIALILDVQDLARRAQVGDVGSRVLVDHAVGEAQDDADSQSFLVFQVSERHRMAAPLSVVSRLEKIPASAIERSGDREVVQYRGWIMPLVDLAAHFGAEAPHDPVCQVIVLQEAGRSVGLVVSDILDIMTAPLDLQRRSGRPGLVGSAVIQERVTDLIDLRAVVRHLDPGFFEREVA